MTLSAHWWALTATLSGTRTLILHPLPRRVEEEVRPQRVRMCPGQHTQSTGCDLSPGGPGCRTWGPHHWRATCPSAPALGPPLHARAHWSQSRALGWLWYQEAFRSWLCPLAHPGLPSYTIYNMHRSQVSGATPRPFPTPNTLNGETSSKALCYKMGGGGGVNYTPFSKTRNKCLQFWDLDINGSCQLSSL